MVENRMFAGSWHNTVPNQRLIISSHFSPFLIGLSHLNECSSFDPVQHKEPHHILTSYVFMYPHQFGQQGVWTLVFPVHKFVPVWQAWEACSQELPTSSRKLEKHTQPGVMMASNPWPSIFHKHGCCMYAFLSLWHTFLVMTRNCKDFLRGLSRVSADMMISLKSFFCCCCSMDHFWSGISNH